MYLFILGFGSGGIEELYHHFDLTHAFCLASAKFSPHLTHRKVFANFRRERNRKKKVKN
jgi:hypothetical protein